MTSPSNAPEEHEEPSLEKKPAGAVSNLRQAYKNSLVLKIMTFGTPIVLLGLYLLISYQAPEHMKQSSVDALPDIPGALPGQGDAAYQRQVTAYDRQRANDAHSSGGSNMITPPIPEAEDPLADYRSMTPVTPEIRTAVIPVQSQGDSLREANLRKLVAAVSERENGRRRGLSYVRAPEEQPPQETAANASATPAAAASTRTKTLLRSGSIAYGTNAFEVNSDNKTPVIVTLYSPPLLKGGTAFGSYEESEEGLVLKFNRVSDAEGNEYAVDAIGVDPNKNDFNVADDVDHHTFRRIVLPAAASFIQGFASAIAQPRVDIQLGSTYVATSQTERSTQEAVAAGIGSAADSSAGMLQDQASKLKTTKRSYQNREVALLFLAPVTAPVGGAK